MREIKFRAWDKTNHKMLDTENLWIRIYPQKGIDKLSVCNFPDFHIGQIPNEITYDPRTDLEIMQYTGLKDRNSKEIYEGDILNYSLEEQVISVRWDITSASWQFDEHRIFLDDGVGRGDWRFTMGIANNCEIIGNIYEHPHLLEAK